MKIRFKRFKPRAYDYDAPEKYWIYPLCLGCYGRLVGIGITINAVYYHINPLCIIRGLIKQKQEEKYRIYDEDSGDKNDDNTDVS